LRERGWRWCRHHPGVAGLASALVLLLVGVTVVSIGAAAHFDQLARSEAQAADDERQARQEAEEAKRQAEEGKEREAKLRAQAQAAQAKAEANFAKARAAVDEYFTRVSESRLQQVPGMQELRRELLLAALSFYQDFLKERADDPGVRVGLADAYRRVGQI